VSTIGQFLRHVTATLDVAGISYMLTGSLASSMYGIPRATNDIDLVVVPTRERLQVFNQLCRRFSYYVSDEDALGALERETQFNVIDLERGWKVDLIIRKSREFSVTEFERRETHEVEGMRLTIATPEDVLLAKLEWFTMSESERQLADVAGIVRMQSNSLDFAYIERWVSELGLARPWDLARGMAG